MIKHQMALQGTINGSSVINVIENLASVAEFNRVTGIFAYATEAGVDLLVNSLSNRMLKWESSEKRWIISIDFARTEPKALEKLMKLRNSEVRIPFFNEVIMNNFMPHHCFHPKTIIFDTTTTNGIENGPAGFLVGSANLSVSGLALGYENAIAISWNKILSNKGKKHLKAILIELKNIDSLMSIAVPIKKPDIKKYALHRPKLIPKDDDSGKIKEMVSKKAEVSLSNALTLLTAKNFWINIKYVVQNRGAGMPGNQIDLQRGTRVFFGFSPKHIPRNTLLGDVNIKYKNNIITCHMRFGNNYMDKLNLPVPGIDGPPSYEHKTLLFKKLQRGAFELVVGTSSEIRKWKRLSQQQKSKFAMQSGREYGVFS